MDWNQPIGLMRCKKHGCKYWINEKCPMCELEEIDKIAKELKKKNPKLFKHNIKQQCDLSKRIKKEKSKIV